VLAALLAAIGLLATGMTPALAQDGRSDGGGDYLALGDSYAFSYSPLLDPRDAANFVGYSDSVAKTLDLALTNAACPGETSGSFVSGTVPDNGCHAYYPALLPRHVDYTGAQLTYAVHYLQTHRHTYLVTLQVGGNDFLYLLNHTCAGDFGCFVAGLPGVESQMVANLSAIYTAIRTTAHYRGALVVVPYYSFNYDGGTLDQLTVMLDQAVAQAGIPFHARVADVYRAFKAASAPSGIPCVAGLQIPTSATGCDIHPSAAGHALFASTILAVLGQESGDHGGNHNN
jgi:lysophospholipase L1-like esterase